MQVDLRFVATEPVIEEAIIGLVLRTQSLALRLSRAATKAAAK
jgi:hypothetical protein